MKTYFLVILSFFFLSLKAQEKEKDTLFFEYNNKYINADIEEIPHKFYLFDGSDPSNGTFFFEEIKVINDLNSKKILCLKRFVQSSKFYDKNKNKKLDDYGLWEYFNNYIVFLVKKNHTEIKYIQVESGFIIE